MKTGIIYKLTSQTTQKSYIGQTINLKNRMRKHKYDKYPNAQPNSLPTAIQKYGFNDFKLTIIKNNIPQNQLDRYEKYYIKKYNTIENGYNIARGGKGGATYQGISHANMQHIRTMLSKAKQGDKNPMKKFGYKIAGAKNGMFGKTPHNVKSITIEDVNTKQRYTFSSKTQCAHFMGYKRGSNISEWKHDPSKIKKGYRWIRDI